MKYFIDSLSEILKYLGLLAIPSLIWNIYLYKHQVKENRLRAKRDLALKEIEFSEMTSRHNIEYRNALENCEGEIRERENITVNTLTRKDNETLTRLAESQRYESEKILAEITHLIELTGEQRAYLVRVSLRSKIKMFFSVCLRKLANNIDRR